MGGGGGGGGVEVKCIGKAETRSVACTLYLDLLEDYKSGTFDSPGLPPGGRGVLSASSVPQRGETRTEISK